MDSKRQRRHDVRQSQIDRTALRNSSDRIVPPDVSALLTELADSSDLDTALRQVLGDDMQLKLKTLAAETSRLEDKWGMGFESFEGISPSSRYRLLRSSPD